MKSLFILSLALLAFSVKAQKGTTTFSVSYGSGKGQLKPIMAKAEMTGRFDEGPIRSLEINLAGKVNKNATVEIGISVLNHRYLFTSFDYPGLQRSENRSANILLFPIRLRVDILKYFFISGGFLLNAEPGKSYQADLGVGIGAGVQYYFKKKYGIFIYPQTNIHSLTIGLAENHVAYGIAYRLTKN